MSIKPETTTDLWDEYPVDDRPLPAPGTVAPPPRRLPVITIARAVALVLVFVCVIAVLMPRGDDDAEPETSEPAVLPFIDTAFIDTAFIDESVTATTAPVRAVRWPDDFGWEVTGDAYYSGCVPGSDSSLPDGVWFGYVTGIASSTIDFDLACHYGIEQIDELDSPFIENSNKASRTLELADSLAIYTFSDTDGPIGPIGADDYEVTGWNDGLPDAVITITDGQVSEIRHQPAAG